MKQSGTMILDDMKFSLIDDKETKFYVFHCENQICFNAHFKLEKDLESEIISISIDIQEHQAKTSNLKELVNIPFCVDCIETSDEREDTFYVFEHEPMENYSFKIVDYFEEVDGDTWNEFVRIKIDGVAVIDGYADPYETAKFSGDFWLSVVRL